MNKLHQDTRGFSVVELLITLIVIGVVFGTFLTAFTSIQNINKKSLDLSAANTLAFAKVQEYENKNYTSLPTTSPAGTLVEVEDFSPTLPASFESPKTAKVYVNTVSPSLKQIVVTITFGSGATQRQIQYGNFIQKNGLGR
jgi:prepilin-type N-terminal cleavage/methylation domain-containing protein